MINFLALPLLSKVAGFFITKRRLLTEYIVIAILIIVAAITFILWTQKTITSTKLLEAENKLVTMSHEVEQLKLNNQEHEARLKELDEIRQDNQIALTGLLNDFKDLSMYDRTVRNKLEKLERNNEAIGAYLNTPIPAELNCLLNSCPADENKDGKGTPAN